MGNINGGDIDILTLHTSFMRELASNMLAKSINKHTGVKPDITINEVTAQHTNGDAVVHLDISFTVTDDELKTILKEM